MKLIAYLEKFNLLEQVSNAGNDVIHNLTDWDFAINYRAKSRFGCCKPQLKLVEVTSEYYFQGEVKAEEMDDFIITLLHETAHVIVRERYGKYRDGRKIKSHGLEWILVMRTLGITNIERCGTSSILKEVKAKTAKHRYTCRDCGHETLTKRKLQNIESRYHGGCRRKPNRGTLIHMQLR